MLQPCGRLFRWGWNTWMRDRTRCTKCSSISPFVLQTKMRDWSSLQITKPAKVHFSGVKTCVFKCRLVKSLENSSEIKALHTLCVSGDFYTHLYLISWSTHRQLKIFHKKASGWWPDNQRWQLRIFVTVQHSALLKYSQAAKNTCIYKKKKKRLQHKMN